MAEARRALEQRQFDEALKGFEKVLQLLPEDADALHGKALALFGRLELKRAGEAIERAARMGPDNRAILNNLAVIRDAQGEQMRAAKVLSEYLAKQKGVPDETLVDALGVVLDHLGPRGRRGMAYFDCVKQFDEAMRKLELQLPGLRRWGYDWVDPDELARLRGAADADLREIEALDQRASEAEAAVREGLRQRSTIQTLVMRGWREPFELNQLDADIRSARSSAEQLRAMIADHDIRRVRPRWPDSISLLPMDATDAPPLGARRLRMRDAAQPHRPDRGPMLPPQIRPSGPVAPPVAVPDRPVPAPPAPEPQSSQPPTTMPAGGLLVESPAPTTQPSEPSKPEADTDRRD